MLPIRFFEGYHLVKHARVTWLVLYAVALLAFIEIVARPEFAVAHAPKSSFGVFTAFFAVIATITITAWFVFRRWANEEKAAARTGAGRGH
jgi:cellobiose-specific phosphotransferase system component IIC